MLFPWECAGILTSLIKASLAICLVRSENEQIIQLLPLGLLSLSPPPREKEKKKKHLFYKKSIHSQTKFCHFSFLLSPHQIICYGFSMVEIFGSSLRRSLNINTSLKIKITSVGWRECCKHFGIHCCQQSRTIQYVFMVPDSCPGDITELLALIKALAVILKN